MTSLQFGTSGLRGLVVDLDGEATPSYVSAFLDHLGKTGHLRDGDAVLVGRDLRSSSPSIAGLCAQAIVDAGFDCVDCGPVPTPALALEARRRNAAAIMVTGSHIPDDRNGLKFYRPDGEIDKTDEQGIVAALAGSTGAGPSGLARMRGAVHDEAEAGARYVARYLGFFPADALSGLHVGVYQQSSVARDLLVELLTGLGATAEQLARASAFIPVDTEAHRPEDKALLLGWGGTGRFDAIVSTDGDADRPLLADETGGILRGDIVGLLTARHLGLSSIVTPVTSSSAIEAFGPAGSVIRTRVGSPFVIAGMQAAADAGRDGIAGFEANGGFLLGSDIETDGRRLASLPTRDAALPILSVLAAAKSGGLPLSALVRELGAGHAAAHRLQNIPADRSGPWLRRLATDAAYRRGFFAPVGDAIETSDMDGVRSVMADGSVIHFRASGNAPELRCYVEAAREGVAQSLVEWGLEAARGEVTR